MGRLFQCGVNVPCIRIAIPYMLGVGGLNATGDQHLSINRCKPYSPKPSSIRRLQPPESLRDCSATAV